MRLSCCAYSYRQYLTSGQMTLDQFVETAAEIGFDGVELTAYYFPTTDRDYLNDLKRKIHRVGLAISGTAIGTDFTQPESDKRSAHVQMAKEWIERSVVLGAPTMRVFAGRLQDEDAFARCVECLAECAEIAKREGVVLALENHGGLTSTADQTLRLFRTVDSGWLGLNLDFGNFSGDAYGQFEACAPFAVAAHAKSHYNGPDGRDEVDYARLRRILDGADYRGWVAIEYEETEEPITAVPRFAAQLRSAFT